MRQTRGSVTFAAAFAILALAGVPAHAAMLFTAGLTGAAERPTPVATPATGVGGVLLNDAENSIQIVLSWQNLTTTATLAHIHGPAGPNDVASPIIDLTNALPPPPNLTGSLQGSPLNVAVTPQQVAQLKAGLWYFNVHTTNFPNGEIRGQIVPEPGTALLLAAGLLGLAVRNRR